MGQTLALHIKIKFILTFKSKFNIHFTDENCIVDQCRSPQILIKTCTWSNALIVTMTIYKACNRQAKSDFSLLNIYKE